MRFTTVAVPSCLALSLLAAGCGDSKLKGSDVEKQIMGAGTAYKSVSCPKEIEAKKGYTFTCDADTTAGAIVVTVKITSVDGDKGHMTIVKATPKK